MQLRNGRWNEVNGAVRLQIVDLTHAVGQFRSWAQVPRHRGVIRYPDPPEAPHTTSPPSSHVAQTFAHAILVAGLHTRLPEGCVQAAE